MLSEQNYKNEWSIRYVLFEKKKASLKTNTIHVQAFSKNTHTRYLYWFQANTDYVPKAKLRGPGNKESYFLMPDSNYIPQLNHWDSAGINESLKINGKFEPLTTIDSIIFEKIIVISDSLNFRNFEYLRKCQGFKLVASKGKNL